MNVSELEYLEYHRDALQASLIFIDKLLKTKNIERDGHLKRIAITECKINQINQLKDRKDEKTWKTQQEVI